MSTTTGGEDDDDKEESVLQTKANFSLLTGSTSKKNNANDAISTCAEDTVDSSSSSSCSSLYSSDDSSSSSSSNSVSVAESKLVVGSTTATHCQDDDDKDDKYIAQVRQWTERIPIGLGLCPWAIKSQRQGRLRYTTCEGNTPSDVESLILLEAQALCYDTAETLCTTLVVCPRVTAWKDNFSLFDEFVKSLGKRNSKQQQSTNNYNQGDKDPLDISLLQQRITLVAFHPKFSRWHGLPEEITIESIVQSHRGQSGFQKSQDTFDATVVETQNSVFGLRRIKVRFHDDGKEQYVPIDWLVIKSGDDDDNNQLVWGPPLPDNAMHRAPYPTIHLIRNQDLATLCARDVSRVKRFNAKRMMNLGWEGVQRKMGILKEEEKRVGCR